MNKKTILVPAVVAAVASVAALAVGLVRRRQKYSY
jgi:hypothetical protein